MMKDQRESGVLLFKRDGPSTLCTKYEKSLVIEPAPGFASPCGIAINTEFVFVCDKVLAGVFKINIATEEVIQKIFYPNGKFSFSALSKISLLICIVCVQMPRLGAA